GQLQTPPRAIYPNPDFRDESGSGKPSAVKAYAVIQCQERQNYPAKGKQGKAGRVDLKIEKKCGEKAPQQKRDKVAMRRDSYRYRGIKLRGNVGRIMRRGNRCRCCSKIFQMCC